MFGQGAGHIGEVENPALAIVAGDHGLGLGWPGGGWLWAGEHHRRQARVVDPGRPWIAVGQRVAGGDLSGGGVDVDPPVRGALVFVGDDGV